MSLNQLCQATVRHRPLAPLHLSRKQRVGKWPKTSSKQTHLDFLPPSSLSASTVKEEVFAYCVQMSAGRSALPQLSRDCVRFVTSKFGVLRTSTPSFMSSASTFVLQASTSLCAKASAALASDHFLSTSSTLESVTMPAFPFGDAASFLTAPALALALAFPAAPLGAMAAHLCSEVASADSWSAPVRFSRKLSIWHSETRDF
mmetsp:Transcript_48856/g.131131  ORF Transcript_48856/g.131131 Transcript_48856/m.131131 type:complete len:202 (-) Transcript_48856:49-654(-)